MDELKNHINKNREKFDHYSFDANELWPTISQGINQRKPRFSNWKTLMRIAASIALVFIVSVGVYRLVANSGRFDDGISLKDISPELAETEYYYSRLVKEKFDVISSSQVQLDPVIQSEFQMLDSAYSELKNDLMDNADNEEVINAMIQNYRIKLQILEQILNNIQSNEDKEDEEGFSI